jgi:hypothetical protein
MSDLMTAAAGSETRRSMVCVWMAVSAVWVGFWLVMAAIAVVAARIDNPFAEDLGAFAVIVLTPPLVTFVLGSAFRLTFEAVAQGRNRRRH